MRIIQMVLFAATGWLSWSCASSPAGADAGTSTVDVGAGGSTADAGVGGGGQSHCSSREDFSEACQLERNKKCFQEPLSACANAEYCEILVGAKINTVQACVEMPMAGIACGTWLFGCTGAETRATAPDGTPWMLSGGCLPFGWSEGDSSGLPSCGAGGSGGGGGTGP